MSETEIFTRLGLALAIGFLIGLERGWRERDHKEGERTAGLRTFTLIGFAGGLFALLALQFDPMVFAVAFVAVAAIIAAIIIPMAPVGNNIFMSLPYTNSRSAFTSRSSGQSAAALMLGKVTSNNKMNMLIAVETYIVSASEGVRVDNILCPSIAPPIGAASPP